MPLPIASLPPVPADTVHAAEAAFGKGNLYLAIGDRVNQLFADVDLTALDRSDEKPVTLLIRLSLATIFQFMEDLPDYQASEAVRTRTDWKYALHLRMDYPGFHPRVLCEFRQRLLSDAAGQQVLQLVFDRLAEAGLFRGKDSQQLGIADVLSMVCTLSRVEETARTMHIALESLTVHRPDWLRTNALPHWYERYDRKSTALRRARCKAGWEELAQAIGNDTQYLLAAIAKACDPGLDLLPEIQALRREWYRQYVRRGDEIVWRSPRCAECDEACIRQGGV